MSDVELISRQTILQEIDAALVLLEQGDVQTAIDRLAVLHFGLSQDQALYHRACYELDGENVCH